MAIIVIPCRKQKKDVRRAPAFEMYGASAFNRGLQKYATTFYKRKDFYFLSARYGLVHCDQLIDNYEEKLTRLTDDKKTLLEKTTRAHKLTGTRAQVHFIGGKLYHRWLQHVLPKAVHLSASCRGMGYINQLVKQAVDTGTQIAVP